MLLETLEAWLDSGGSPTQTGRPLHLHAPVGPLPPHQLREVLGTTSATGNHLTLQSAIKSRRHLTT